MGRHDESQGAASTGMTPADQVRAALLAAGYTADGVLGRIGAVAFSALGRGERAPALHALAAGPTDALSTLIRLFGLREPVPGWSAQEAVPLAAAAALGLADATDSGPAEVRAPLAVTPYPVGDTEAFIVADHPMQWSPAAQPGPEDLVVGVGGASVTLATITPRRPVARTLDLGTGCGIQAVLAAAHSASVVATDTNPRALTMAARTGAMSGSEFDLREGSLYAPVQGEAFDLLVANPPFVIAPGRRFLYRESPLRGDDLSRAVVAGAADHLEPGGIAVILANWLHVEGQSWTDRVASWADQAVDSQVWAAQRERLPLPEYVELWLRDSADHRGDPGQYEARYDEWLTYLEGLGATGVGFGWVVIRREGPRWFVAEDVADAERLPNGEEVLAQLADFDALQAADANALLTASPRWSDRAVRHRIAPAGVEAAAAEILVTGSWRPPEEVDPIVDALLAGTGPLVQRIDDVVLEAGGLLDDDLVTVLALTGLRRLIGAGLVDRA